MAKFAMREMRNMTFTVTEKVQLYRQERSS